MSSEEDGACLKRIDQAVQDCRTTYGVQKPLSLADMVNKNVVPNENDNQGLHWFVDKYLSWLREDRDVSAQVDERSGLLLMLKVLLIFERSPQLRIEVLRLISELDEMFLGTAYSGIQPEDKKLIPSFSHLMFWSMFIDSSGNDETQALALKVYCICFHCYDEIGQTLVGAHETSYIRLLQLAVQTTFINKRMILNLYEMPAKSEEEKTVKDLALTLATILAFEDFGTNDDVGVNEGMVNQLVSLVSSEPDPFERKRTQTRFFLDHPPQIITEAVSFSKYANVFFDQVLLPLLDTDQDAFCDMYLKSLQALTTDAAQLYVSNERVHDLLMSGAREENPNRLQATLRTLDTLLSRRGRVAEIKLDLCADILVLLRENPRLFIDGPDSAAAVCRSLAGNSDLFNVFPTHREVFLILINQLVDETLPVKYRRDIMHRMYFSCRSGLLGVDLELRNAMRHVTIYLRGHLPQFAISEDRRIDYQGQTEGIKVNPVVALWIEILGLGWEATKIMSVLTAMCACRCLRVSNRQSPLRVLPIEVFRMLSKYLVVLPLPGDQQ